MGSLLNTYGYFLSHPPSSLSSRHSRPRTLGHEKDACETVTSIGLRAFVMKFRPPPRIASPLAYLCRRLTPVFHLVPTHRAQRFLFQNCDALDSCTPTESKAKAMAVDQKYYETPGHVIAAAVALSILDIVALFLRFYTRRRKNQGLKIDDWLLVPAVVSHTQKRR